jgi:hypothetical protein
MIGTRGKLGSVPFLLLTASVAAAPFAHAAKLTVTFTPIPQGEVVNLTGEGALDWVHWGLVTESSLNRKAGVVPQIPDFTPIRLNGPYQLERWLIHASDHQYHQRRLDVWKI